MKLTWFPSAAAPSRPRGVTLIELLITVGILTMLLAISLAMLRPVMKDTKVREASRMLNAFLAGVQARAVALDRPVGAYMEVQRYGDGQAATLQLFAAESPPPYAGDTMNATVTLTTRTGLDLASRRYREADLDENSASASVLCAAGDFIRFGFKGPWYEIYRIDTDTNAVKYYVDRYAMPPLRTDTPDTKVAYQILRKPRKSAVSPMDLPEPMVIDIGSSGIGLDGAFASYFSSDAPNTTLRPVPIIISFKPTGGIDLVYVGTYEDLDQDGTVAELEYHVIRPAAAVHLLIGWSDKLHNPNVSDVPDNLADTANRWVSIGSATGRITTTENAGLDGTGANNYAKARRYAKDAQGMGSGT